MRAGIVGAGLLGRLLALALLQKNWHVTLFDQDNEKGYRSCGWAAAGMISPYTESITTEILISQLGIESLHLWPNLLASLHQHVDAHFSGSLILAHPQDMTELWRFKHGFQNQNMLTELDPSLLKKVEPELADRFQRGLFIANEGHVSIAELWPALLTTLKALGATWYPNTQVIAMNQCALSTIDHQRYEFDQIFDCRGLSAQVNLADLRGVRGELLWLHAPDVHIQHAVRLMHPRYALYIVPRSDQVYVVGATSIESEDMSAISVQSMLELLSAA